MNRLKFIFIIFVVAAMIPTFVNAQLIFNGNRGLNYVHSASTLPAGFLTTKLYSRGYSTVSNEPTGSVNIYDLNGRLSINYGLSKHFELAVTPLLYGDTNFGVELNNPGDVFMSVKFGSLGSPGSSLTYGLAVNTKVPLGKVYNIPFEPYGAKRIGFGATGMISYSKDALYPDEALNLHFNLGYWNHNDVGAKLTNNVAAAKPASMSQEILYAMGVRVPKNKFEFSAELYGNFFLKAPPESAYSRENYLYISPAASYKLTRWMSLSLGADLRIFESSDKTLYAPAAAGIARTLASAQPNYAGWRLNFGTHFSLLPTKMYRPNQRDVLLQKAENRRELFEKIIREQRATESAEAELERIKAERVRAEKELARLRRILEGNLKKDRKEMRKEKEENGN
ncbi:hypothetical protein IH785_18160 [candidate division KSB1 bacterium]|nr:hypothetical protein [candidate division KSB1 bacterium]